MQNEVINILNLIPPQEAAASTQSCSAFIWDEKADGKTDGGEISQIVLQPQV